MTRLALAIAGLRHHGRTHGAVAFGVASAVAVLAGALLVGASVRSSLAGLVHARLGAADLVVVAETPFASSLGSRLVAQRDAGIDRHAAMLTLAASVRHDASGRRASDVSVYGVDAAFFAFHGATTEVPEQLEAWLSPDLAAELGAAEGDAVVARVPRPTDVPLDSLFGDKDGAGRSFRLRAKGALPRERMGEFSLGADQGPVRAVFMSLARLQRDLGLAGRANALLLARTSPPASDATPPLAQLAAAIEPVDLGLTVAPLPDGATILIESASGLINDATATAIERAGAELSLEATPVLTWLATSLTIGDRSTPYSLVSALGATAGGDASLAQGLYAGAPDRPAIVLNDWAARDLRAKPGDILQLEYFRWADEGRLVTDTAKFVVSGVVPITGVAADQRLAPVFPGITDSATLGDWNPPFPIDLTRVRPIDDEYWQERRTTPKAFVALTVGQKLWGTRYGKLTSIRLHSKQAGVDLGMLSAKLADRIARGVDPAAGGLQLIDVRRQNIAAAAGVTDFGAYFTYFSFFLMVSAILLTSLFFRLSVEQRASEVGVLRAVGFASGEVRRQFLIEGGVVAAVGTIVGVVLAIGWAALMMYGLRVWWVGAVGTTRLQLHVDVASLAIGALGGLVAALVSIAWTVRAFARATPRQLLTGARDLPSIRPDRRSGVLAALAAIGALALAASAAWRLVPDVAGFFGAGALVLVAGLLALRQWLSVRPRIGTHSGIAGLARLGIDNASWRPNRTLAAAGLVAAAVFLLVAVDLFRKGAAHDSGPASGTGGYALVGESVLPFAYDPATLEGRRALDLDTATGDAALASVELMAARLRPGDDTSCLNLYAPATPRILGVGPRWVEANRFRFAASTAVDEAARENPWRLLGPADAEGVVPAIADATSLQYVLHAAVGDVITVDAATPRPLRLRIVGALADSILQGEIVIAESAFVEVFPKHAGYRFLLVAVPPATANSDVDVDKAATALEDRLAPYGLDLQSSAGRLEAYHRVENTYLSTFQTLGGLGLVLGCAGLAAIVARNVLERRRELALLGATGFTGRALQVVVLAEQAAIVCWGLAIGLGAALVAVAPIAATRGMGRLSATLFWPAVVLIVGLLSAAAATRSLRRLPLVASLRSE